MVYVDKTVKGAKCCILFYLENLLLACWAESIAVSAFDQEPPYIKFIKLHKIDFKKIVENTGGGILEIITKF
jgi:hypothetical protein